MSDFNENAARVWLQGPDKNHPEWTVAENVGIYEDFGYGYGVDWLAMVDRLVAEASDTDLLPKDTLVWLVSDGDGVVDGALITRDLPGGVRLCSHHNEWIDLTDDTDAKGIDQAVAILRSVHEISSGMQLPPKEEQ